MLTLAAIAANCDPHADEIVQRNTNWSGRGYRCNQNDGYDDSCHGSNETQDQRPRANAAGDAVKTWIAKPHSVILCLLAVRCIAFHEKGCKLKFIWLEVREIGIVLPYGLKVGLGLDPKLAIIFSKDGTLPSG